MFKGLILATFAMLGLLSTMSAISSDEVTKSSDLNATMHVEKLVLGSGCFWGAEKRYEALNGVLDAESGYADGHGFKPTYRNITKLSRRFDEDNYAEVVQVTFNSNIISAKELLQNYYESHDPTQKNRQGNDVGTQYRSIILTTSDEQANTALAVTQQYQQLLTKAGYGTIATQIKPLERFYSAEEYHQNYLEKNPNGYCPDHSTGVVFSQDEKQQAARVPIFKFFTPDLNPHNWKLIIAKVEVSFVGELFYAHEVTINTSIEQIGNSSFALCDQTYHRVLSLFVKFC